MAFFDRFLKRKEEKKRTAPKAETKKPAPLLAAAPKGNTKNFAFGVGVIRGPHVTEKAAALSASRQYIFKVSDSANKPAIREAVAKRYGVEVTRVNVITVPSKTRRMGRRIGKTPGYTKAVVTLREGQAIDLE